MLRTEPRPLTVHDYRELPEGPPYYQLIEGDLHISPSPGLFHQDILMNIAVIIRNFLAKHPLGKVVAAPSDVRLTDLNVYQPDLYFVSNGRRSIFSDHGVEDAPDLVIEILSSKTAKLDKGVTREIYARTGVNELWIVDPVLRQIQVYHLSDSADVPSGTFSGKQEFTSRLLPGLRIKVQRVFHS